MNIKLSGLVVKLVVTGSNKQGIPFTNEVEVSISSEGISIVGRLPKLELLDYLQTQFKEFEQYLEEPRQHQCDCQGTCVSCMGCDGLPGSVVNLIKAGSWDQAIKDLATETGGVMSVQESEEAVKEWAYKHRDKVNWSGVRAELRPLVL